MRTSTNYRHTNLFIIRLAEKSLCPFSISRMHNNLQHDNFPNEHRPAKRVYLPHLAILLQKYHSPIYLIEK